MTASALQLISKAYSCRRTELENFNDTGSVTGIKSFATTTNRNIQSAISRGDGYSLL